MGAVCLIITVLKLISRPSSANFTKMVRIPLIDNFFRQVLPLPTKMYFRTRWWRIESLAISYVIGTIPSDLQLANIPTGIRPSTRYGVDESLLAIPRYDDGSSPSLLGLQHSTCNVLVAPKYVRWSPHNDSSCWTIRFSPDKDDRDNSGIGT